MRPHRAEVIADRVVAPLAHGHRANAPAGEKPVAHQQLDAARGLVLVCDAAPEQVADVRRDGVDDPPVAVDGERVASSILHPVVAVELRLERGRRLLEPLGEPGIVPDLPRQSRTADLRVVHIPLDLARRPRQLRVGAVREQDGVPGVLPALVFQPGFHVTLIIDVAVTVAVAVIVDPFQGGPGLQLEVPDELVVTGPPGVLVEEDEKQRGCVGRAVVRRVGPFLESRQLAISKFMKDLPGLLVAEFVDARALESGQRKERGLCHVRDERQGLQARDHAVATEDAHEPGQPCRRQRALAQHMRLKPQGRQVDEASHVDARKGWPVALQRGAALEPAIQVLATDRALRAALNIGA